MMDKAISATRDAAQLRRIADVVDLALRDGFGNVTILEVKVRDDADLDGDEVLRIDVIFEGDRKNIDVRKLSSAVRHVRPRLRKIDENAFPLFSFISNGELGGRKRASA